MARLLVGRPLHVVTNSLPVANLFASDTNSDLVMVGGNICPRTGVAQGPLADQMIAALRVRKTVLSVAAVHEDGFFNNNLMLVETERTMMKAADGVIVVVDSSKFGRQSLARLCGLDAVQTLVVDDGIDQPWRDRLLAAGVDLRVAIFAPAAGEEVVGRIGNPSYSNCSSHWPLLPSTSAAPVTSSAATNGATCRDGSGVR